MLERGLLVAGLLLVVIVAALVAREVARRRAATATARGLPSDLLARFAGVYPGIVYFSGPHCPACRQQSTILDQIVAERGLPVVRVDAAAETALADRLAIATVPATVVVDGHMHVRAINLGFRSHDALVSQLSALGQSPA